MEPGIYLCYRCGQQTRVEIPDREAVAHGSMLRVTCAHCDWSDVAQDLRVRPRPPATPASDAT